MAKPLKYGVVEHYNGKKRVHERCDSEARAIERAAELNQRRFRFNKETAEYYAISFYSHSAYYTNVKKLS